MTKNWNFKYETFFSRVPCAHLFPLALNNGLIYLLGKVIYWWKLVYWVQYVRDGGWTENGWKDDLTENAPAHEYFLDSHP